MHIFKFLPDLRYFACGKISQNDFIDEFLIFWLLVHFRVILVMATLMPVYNGLSQLQISLSGKL